MSGLFRVGGIHTAPGSRGCNAATVTQCGHSKGLSAEAKNKAVGALFCVGLYKVAAEASLTSTWWMGRLHRVHLSEPGTITRDAFFPLSHHRPSRKFTLVTVFIFLGVFLRTWLELKCHVIIGSPSASSPSPGGTKSSLAKVECTRENTVSLLLLACNRPENIRGNVVTCSRYRLLVGSLCRVIKCSENHNKRPLIHKKGR